MFQKCPFADEIARKLEISTQMSNLPGKLLLWLRPEYKQQCSGGLYSNRNRLRFQTQKLILFAACFRETIHIKLFKC